MSKGIGKKVAVGLAAAVGTMTVLLMLSAALVVSGTLTQEHIPLWAIRVAGPTVGVLIAVPRKPRKRKRKKRR